ncbi:unnamed protein product [Rotaria sp. Silwood1]|nr:unnamed protein product [Rotaria sp. Silwood1]CAF1691263.1 unnamed protein product [Rotaria sp. Silwood1]CAF3953176.1 unnamed protein product [Rotaria sp. Silwood1]CAF5024659.1 unnamed protein product [Rotaria sp. Silwood1]
MSLVCLSQQLTIYVGLFLLIIGIFGNGTNIFIFSSVRSYRISPATFYFLVESMAKIVFLTTNLLLRVVSFYFEFDLSRTSLIWCRLRQVLLTLSSTITVTCTCLATMDQFFVTSSNPSLCQISKIQRAYQIVLNTSIIWFLHSLIAYFNVAISPFTGACASSNSTVIPITITMIFGYLTYRNIRQTTVLAEQQADRQVVKMVLLQIILIIISNTPLGGLNTYGLITTGVIKSQEQQLQEYCASLLINLIASIYFAAGFYTFLISSSRFRQTVKERLFR